MISVRNHSKIHPKMWPDFSITLTLSTLRWSGNMACSLEPSKNGPIAWKKSPWLSCCIHATGDRWTLDMTDGFCPIQKNEGQEHCWWTIHWDSWTVKQNLSQHSQGAEGKKSERTFFCPVSARWLHLMRDDYKLIDPEERLVSSDLGST